MAKNSVRRLREELGWGIRELARRADINTTTLRNVEKGQPCRMSTAMGIMRALSLQWPEDRDLVFPNLGTDLSIGHEDISATGPYDPERTDVRFNP